jgi:hypothetical protein
MKLCQFTGRRKRLSMQLYVLPGIGAYRTDAGKPYILRVVKEVCAELIS